jgi:hypothetical protein
VYHSFAAFLILILCRTSLCVVKLCAQAPVQPNFRCRQTSPSGLTANLGLYA